MSQRLLPRADGQGRALAAEVLIATPYIRDCIAEPDKTSLIADAIAAGGSQYGMQTFDQAILRLCEQGLVTVEEALRWVTNVEEFKMRLRGITTGTVAAMAGSPNRRHSALRIVAMRPRRRAAGDSPALPAGSAWAMALRLLMRRDYTSAELREPSPRQGRDRRGR